MELLLLIPATACAVICLAVFKSLYGSSHTGLFLCLYVGYAACAGASLIALVSIFYLPVEPLASPVMDAALFLSGFTAITASYWVSHTFKLAGELHD